MSISWQAIAECLRAELADYGGLLLLFEQQQRSLFVREAGSVLEIANRIETEARGLAETRHRREVAVATFAVEHEKLATSSVRDLLPLIEASARPLVEALVTEINHLLHRVRRISRHNHLMLARTVEMHQETLQLLRPEAFTKTYSPAGRVSMMSPRVGALRAAG